MDLFEYQAQQSGADERPLAERLRPRSLAEFCGQSKIVGAGSFLRQAIESDRIFSMILWGPPGCGKTTLAHIIARETKAHFVHFSAVLSGVKAIRAVISAAQEQRRLYRQRTLLFVDEIHRFNKSQQDAFLPHVESGLITLIGATTENPSFEVISPLLSRCRVIPLEALDKADMADLVQRALTDPDRGLGRLNLEIDSDARDHLIRIADGDARALINNLEIAANLVIGSRTPDSGATARIELAAVEAAFQHKALNYDKGGEQHYNIISAFHKSMRGSDPDAALYWLARMLSAGEDPLYVARRMVRFASEDVGNADPYALRMALSAMDAFRFIGRPEGELCLAQAAVYLACAPKSAAVYKAYKRASDAARKDGSLPVPLHLRNAPTDLMHRMGYGRGYKYAHDYKEGFVAQDHLPEKLVGNVYYFPTDGGYEKQLKQRLEHWRRLREKHR
ncbi:MAG: replication-associated recombination protein A [Desulfosarcinaceae bacterium]|nr:replication-associated recombination protein A [Desulfosarcinaceae bacterium]